MPRLSPARSPPIGRPEFESLVEEAAPFAQNCDFKVEIIEPGGAVLRLPAGDRHLWPGDLVAEGRTMKAGRKLVVPEVDAFSDGIEEPAAHVTGTDSMPPGDIGSKQCGNKLPYP